MSAPDRVGLGWRPELAAAILAHAERIDLLEVIADDWLDAGRRGLRALRTLGAQRPLVLHGTSLGLASSLPVECSRLEAFARVVEWAAPECWSEHLAFVRAGGHEIGHLAAPPRAEATLDGLAHNVARCRAVVGAVPHLENIATLVDPPGSDRDEATWVADAIAATSTGLLLDLHNLHANAVNFGFDAREFLARVPLDRVGLVHVAGGRWVAATTGEQRRLDDHRHAVPDPVWTLLEEVAARAPGPLSVILERDGAYPGIERLLAELDIARGALARGRRRAREVVA